MKETLHRLGEILQRNYPSGYAQLNQGLLNDQILHIEQKFKINLPENLKLLYRWKNGQKEEAFPVLFFGNYFSLEKVFGIMKGLAGKDYNLPAGFIPLFGELTPAPIFIGYDSNGYFNHHPGEIIEIDFDCSQSAVMSANIESFMEEVVSVYEKVSIHKEKFLRFSFKQNKQSLKF